MICWLFGWLLHCLLVCFLLGWLVGWLAGCLVAWLVAWLVSPIHMRKRKSTFEGACTFQCMYVCMQTRVLDGTSTDS